MSLFARVGCVFEEQGGAVLSVIYLGPVGTLSGWIRADAGLIWARLSVSVAIRPSPAH